MRTLILDVEGNDLLRGVTTIHCLCVWCPEEKRGWRFNHQGKPGCSLADGLQLLGTADTLVGHNILRYDLPALKKVHGFVVPPSTKVVDTQVCVQLIWPEVIFYDAQLGERVPKKCWGWHSLEAWGHRLGLHKGEYGKDEKGNLIPDAWVRWSQAMEDYCVQDVVVTSRLYNTVRGQNYSQQALDLEHAFAVLMHYQMENGVGFDVEAARVLYADILKRRREIEDELQRVFPPRIETLKTPAFYHLRGNPEVRWETKGVAKKLKVRDADIVPGPFRTKAHPFSPGSTQQIAERLIERYGWQPKKFTDGGQPQVTEEILEELTYPEAALLKEYLMLQKRAGQIAEGDAAWLKVEQGGVIYGRINTNGAVTGRCTHSSPNLGQVPRVGSPYGKECRSLFRPTRPGWRLVGWDASGLELRCLAHYMALYDGGDYAKIVCGGDIHTANQKAAGLPTRNDAKTFIYAFLYGAGDGKLGSIVGGGASAGKRLRAKFLTELPALKKLTDAVRAQAKKNKFLIGLDGRKLRIRSDHAALNTLLQSAGAVIMKQAAVEQHRILTEAGLVLWRDYAHVLNVHDEIQIEARPEVADIVAKSGPAAIEAAGKVLGFRCPLTGEAKVGNNWADTH